jgi:hypothetical protein
MGQRGKLVDQKFNPRQQLLHRQLLDEAKRRRAQMLFDYYSEDCGMAPRVRQYNAKGLLCIDGVVHGQGEEVSERTGAYRADSAGIPEKEKGIHLVFSRDTRRMENGISKSVQEQEDDPDTL